MDKPVVYYEVRAQEDPSTGGQIYVPAIVEREEAVTLEQIVARAIDRGLIAGLKVNAAKSIADGIARQMYEEFSNGRGVRFGDYFSCRLYLTGTTDANGTLTAKNKIVVRFFNGTAFRLSRDMFAFSNIRGGDIPFIDFLISDSDDAARGTINPSSNILVNGYNLYKEGDAHCGLEFYEVDAQGIPAAEPTVLIDNTTALSMGPNLVTYTWNSGLAAKDKWYVVAKRSADGERWFKGAGKIVNVAQA